jgi:hypothetical protein
LEAGALENFKELENIKMTGISRLAPKLKRRMMILAATVLFILSKMAGSATGIRHIRELLLIDFEY